MLLDSAGSILLGVAVVVYAWALGLFLVVGRGTPLPFAPPERFVVRGPYRYTRNPMALSVVVGATGASLWWRSPVGFASTALAAVVLHLYITRQEEPVLVHRFGDAYLAYCDRVPRWLFGAPKPPRHTTERSG